MSICTKSVIVNFAKRSIRQVKFNQFSYTPRYLFHSNSLFNSALMSEFKVTKSDQEWKAVLSPEQFRVLRDKGTERPGTGEYNKFKEAGVYNCAGCNLPLYKSETKFDSGCGWPAFYEAIPGSIKLYEDKSMGVVRTEMVCSNCGGHLGHVFKGEGFPTPTDERHCVNSVSLKFKPKADN